MKRIAILFGVVALAFGAQAQINQHKNYIGLNVGAGLDNLVYSPTDGARHLGWGYLGELKYMHFFGKHWGFGLGAQYNMTHSNAMFDDQDFTVVSGYVHPDDGQTFDIYSRADVTNVTYRDMPNHGFYTFDMDVDKDIDNVKMGVSAIADLGFNYALSEKWGLYLGIYGGYAINNMLKEAKNQELFAANHPAYNGVLNSNQINNLHLLNLGAKIGINFGWKPYIDPDKARESELVNYYMDEAAKAKASEEDAKAKAAQEVAKAKAAEDAAKAKAAQEAARADAAEKAAKEAPAGANNMLQRYVDLINTTVNFNFSKTKPIYNDETDAAIKAISAAMKENNSLKISITGHTDNIGSDESNMRLGQRRAEALKNVMIEEGAPADNIATYSRGEREPIVDNDTEEHRYQNRRAEIRLR